MTFEEIKKDLRARGLSFSAVGRRMRPQVTPQHVREVARGRESARVRAAIARALERTEEEVFGAPSAPAIAERHVA